MNEKFTDRIVRFGVLLILALIIVGGTALAYPSWRRGQELKLQEADLLRQIEEKKKEIAQLVDNQRRFKSDPDFVESIARRNRRVFPGEIVFQFED